MLVIGKRVIPWVLHYMAHTGSRELFRLAVLSIALGVAYGASAIFDVSFALGAFFAGMILSESELSQRAATETLPLRDAFAVLFFVSVGMLVDPLIVVNDPGWLLATLLIILVGKSLAAFAIVRAVRLPDLARADHLGEPRPDRRVLLHPGRTRRQPRPAAAARSRPDPGRRHHLDPAQPGAVRLPRLVSGQGKPAASAADLKAAAEQALREPIRPTAAHRSRRAGGFGRVGRLVSDGLKAHGLPHAADRGKPPARHPGARGGARGDPRQRRHRRGDRGGQPRPARCI